jgi:predicted permease
MLIEVFRTVTVILGGLVAGYLSRKSGRLSADLSPEINRTTLVYLQPLATALALWGLKDPSWQTAFLPLYGAVLVFAMWPVGAGVARLLRLDRSAQGAFVQATMFSNTGFTYGIFLAFVRLGDEGAALGTIYTLSFMPLVYTLGFVVAARYAHESPPSNAAILREIVVKPESRNPLLAVVVGLLLHFVGPPRPSSMQLLSDVTIPASTAAFLFSIGLGMRLSAIRQHLRACATMHLLKFIISPAVGLGLAYAFGYLRPGNANLLEVCFIQAATPTAIMAIVISQAFNQSRDLANALWLTTNLSAIALAPVILYVTRLMG